MASSNSGTCWYSSIRTGSPDSTNLAGSSRTADLVTGSSQSITGRRRRSPSWLSRVLLPTVRGPLRTTTGSSASRASTTSASRRCARPVRVRRMPASYRARSVIPLDVFRVSGRLFPCFRNAGTVIPAAACPALAAVSARLDRAEEGDWTHEQRAGSVPDLEPIEAVATRAASAVWVRAYPGFKSPSLGSWPGTLPNRWSTWFFRCCRCSTQFTAGAGVQR